MLQKKKKKHATCCTDIMTSINSLFNSWSRTITPNSMITKSIWIWSNPKYWLEISLFNKIIKLTSPHSSNTISLHSTNPSKAKRMIKSLNKTESSINLTLYLSISPIRTMMTILEYSKANAFSNWITYLLSISISPIMASKISKTPDFFQALALNKLECHKTALALQPIVNLPFELHLISIATLTSTYPIPLCIITSIFISTKVITTTFIST